MKATIIRQEKGKTPNKILVIITSLFVIAGLILSTIFNKYFNLIFFGSIVLVVILMALSMKFGKEEIKEKKEEVEIIFKEENGNTNIS